jgi:hypothetical protein
MTRQERNNERGDREAHARAKRMAWGLAALVLVFYVGYFVWNLLQSA